MSTDHMVYSLIFGWLLEWAQLTIASLGVIRRWVVIENIGEIHSDIQNIFGRIDGG